MFDTVVVATDGSASVRRAVATGLDLAADFDAAVHAVSVAPERGDRERAEAALADVAGRTSREVTTAVREGEPADAICEYAREHDADVVALGTRGRGGDSFHLGSVAERVVEQSETPVLTVRQFRGSER